MVVDVCSRSRLSRRRSERRGCRGGGGEWEREREGDMGLGVW